MREGEGEKGGREGERVGLGRETDSIQADR